MQSRVLYNLLQTPAEGEEGWPQNFYELIFCDIFSSTFKTKFLPAVLYFFKEFGGTILLPF
jgi:hypothetical protein